MYLGVRHALWNNCISKLAKTNFYLQSGKIPEEHDTFEFSVYDRPPDIITTENRPEDHITIGHQTQ